MRREVERKGDEWIKRQGCVWNLVEKAWTCGPGTNVAELFAKLQKRERVRQEELAQERHRRGEVLSKRAQDKRRNGAFYAQRAARALEQHRERGWIVFFPEDGYCPRCRENIFARYDPDENEEHGMITGCPDCLRSYCE